LAGGRCFGPIQARNLTPDDSGLPRGMTEAEFIRAMRTGEDVTCVTKPANGLPLPMYNTVPDGVCALNLAFRGKPPGPSAYDPNKAQEKPVAPVPNPARQAPNAILPLSDRDPQGDGMQPRRERLPWLRWRHGPRLHQHTRMPEPAAAAIDRRTAPAQSR